MKLFSRVFLRGCNLFFLNHVCYLWKNVFSSSHKSDETTLSILLSFVDLSARRCEEYIRKSLAGILKILLEIIIEFIKIRFITLIKKEDDFFVWLIDTCIVKPLREVPS